MFLAVNFRTFLKKAQNVTIYGLTIYRSPRKVEESNFEIEMRCHYSKTTNFDLKIWGRNRSSFWLINNPSTIRQIWIRGKRTRKSVNLRASLSLIISLSFGAYRVNLLNYDKTILPVLNSKVHNAENSNFFKKKSRFCF